MALNLLALRSFLIIYLLLNKKNVPRGTFPWNNNWKKYIAKGVFKVKKKIKLSEANKRPFRLALEACNGE